MSCGGSGRSGRGRFGGRGGDPPGKRCNDHEVGSSSLHLSVEDWRKEQARKRGALSRSSGRRVLSNFERLDHIFSPTITRLRAEKKAWFEAKEAAAIVDEAAALRVKALFDEYQLAQVLSSSLMEYHLRCKKPDDDDDDDDDDK